MYVCRKLLLNSFCLYNLWYTSSVDKSVPNVCEPFSGDYEGAIDTLRMAITLIKQSVTANSEASQVRHCALRAQRLVQFHTVPLITFTRMRNSLPMNLYYTFTYFVVLQIMIQSLQDCLQGMEQQAAVGK